MSQSYTLAGPDIGSCKVDTAGLEIELGDELAAWVVKHATARPLEIPGTTTRRIVRLYQEGDEGRGWQAFANSTRPVATVEGAPPPNPPATRAATEEDEHHAVLEPRNVADPACILPMSAQTLADRADKEELTVYGPSFDITIPVKAGAWVFAPDETTAKFAFEAYLRGEALPKGTGVVFIPRDVAAHALAQANGAESLADAGWEFRCKEPWPVVSKEHTKQLARQLARAEFLAYRAQVESEGDLLDKLFRM
jgi:hypothetical protein